MTIITQTVVRRDDPACELPSKPIGHALAEAAAARKRERGDPVGRDGRGRWRRLAPSPAPIDVVEVNAVRRLVEEGRIVIAAGGGGPPVYYDPRLRWEGVEAVVDKDRVAAILGSRLDADALLILTDVDGVYRRWGAPDAERLTRLSVTQARDLLEGGELRAGSMRPKVEAAVAFLEGGGRRAIIAHLEDGLAAMRGASGTMITGDGT
jgi:carbamate kinase